MAWEECSKGNHRVPSESIAARRNGEAVCISCLNASVKGPKKTRIITGSELSNRADTTQQNFRVVGR